MRRFLSIITAVVILAACPVQGQFVPRGSKSESLVHIDGENYWIHNVEPEDTVYSLSRLYEVSEEDITGNNPLVREGLKAGQVIKIPARQQQEQLKPRKQSKLFEEHIVRAGETAYSIARSYGISLTTLTEDNPDIDPTQLPTDHILKIRKKEMGETSPVEVSKQWENYRDAANTVSEDYVYHIVKPGETLYSLSRMFGIGQEELVDINQLQEGLKANGIIRIPVKPDTQETAAGTSPQNATQGIERQGALDFDSKATSPSSYRPNSIPNIAMMLPLEEAGAANSDFIDFYRGSLLAFEDLKASGHSMKVTLYNSGRTESKVREIIASPGFSNVDLIIGPVYESTMAPALQYAEAYKIPMVSPLAPVRELDGETLYQMAPDHSTKYDKMRNLFSGGKNVILVSSGSGDDREFEREITAELGAGNYGRFTLGSSGDITSLIDWNRENVFVVLAGTELGVDKVLASLSSASARRSRQADIKVVGSSKWAGYNSSSIDKDLFFKLNVCFVTSYYVDRSNGEVARFEARYLETYGDFPSRSAYRGYDAVKLFAGALFQSGYSFNSRLGTGNVSAPLQTPYRFVQKDGSRHYVNDQWALVSFRNNYDIIVE